MDKVLYIAHRINTIDELKSIPINYGIEIDLRNDRNFIILAHDPFELNVYDEFEEYLKYYKHAFLILNIKTEGIEFRVLELLKKYNITNYFFLDCSFPMIHKLIELGETNIAIRFSEFESFNTIMNLKNKIKWIWVDCFTKFPVCKDIYKIFKNNNFKLCYVSPELQNQENKLEIYKDFIKKNNLIPNMICTKVYNIDKWKIKF
jgi:hypothetical protein